MGNNTLVTFNNNIELCFIEFNSLKLSKMKKFIVFLVLFNLSNQLNAQNVSYSILEDDPYKIKQLYLRINPFYAEGFRTNKASIGGGIELRYVLKNKIIFNFNNWKSYTTIAETLEKDKFLVRDLSAEYILFDKSSSEDVKIVLSSSSSGNYTTTKYIRVPGTTRKVFSVRGGIFNYKTPFKTSSLKNKSGSILDTGGVKLSGFVSPGVLLKSTSVFGGLSYSIIHNTKISAIGFGKSKANAVWLNYYVDFLFAPIINFQDFYAENSDKVMSLFEINSGENGIEKNRLGWRTGFVSDFDISKRITYSGRVEIGSRPGIKSNGFYLYCGLGMTIPILKSK
jgi:hypothetical protein